LCQAAKLAEEKGIISEQLAERVCAISKNHVHYKHLGLEIHGLIAHLVPVDGKGRSATALALDEFVQKLEDRYRRI
jgi:type IV secretory pathway protease TraF